MKFFSVALIFVALIAAAVCSQHCDYDCDQQDPLATCVYNGQCYLQMKNLCALQKYNCLNPQRSFHQVDQHACKLDSAPQCQPGDY